MFNKIKNIYPFHKLKMRHFSTEKQIIRIYHGEGVSDIGYKMTTYSINKFMDKKKYKTQEILPDEVNKGKWINDTSLIVFPGGKASPFVRDLSINSGNKNGGNKYIKEYVENGGSYLGICAGAYYACKRVEFDIGGPLQIKGDRELCFFNGIAEGPAYEGFSYTDDNSCRCIWLLYPYFTYSLVEEILTCSSWYYGGPHFVLLVYLETL